MSSKSRSRNRSWKCQQSLAAQLTLMKRRVNKTRCRIRFCLQELGSKWWLAQQWVPGKENWTLVAQRGSWFATHLGVIFPVIPWQKKIVNRPKHTIIITALVVSHVVQRLSQFFYREANITWPFSMSCCSSVVASVCELNASERNKH